jgi:hypothetical protein
MSANVSTCGPMLVTPTVSVAIKRLKLIAAAPSSGLKLTKKEKETWDYKTTAAFGPL